MYFAAGISRADFPKAYVLAEQHLLGNYQTEAVWRLLKSYRIEDRIPYTQGVCDLCRLGFIPENEQALNRYQEGVQLLVECLGYKLLSGRVAVDLKAQLLKIWRQSPEAATALVQAIARTSLPAIVTVLLKGMNKNDLCDFPEMISPMLDRSAIVDLLLDTPYIDRLHATYDWPECLEHLSSKGMTGMLERDLGL
jgi:hypothetical protein